MKKLNLIVFFILIIGCSSKYTYFESRADIDGWERKKFGIYSSELGFQFSVSNSALIATEDNFLGFKVEKKINYPEGRERLVISMVAEAYVDDMYISARPTLMINGKKVQPESVLLGQHVNVFPCEMQKLIADQKSVLIPKKSQDRFCVIYIYDVVRVEWKDFFELRFDQYFHDESRSILVKFTPQEREEVVTH